MRDAPELAPADEPSAMSRPGLPLLEAARFRLRTLDEAIALAGFMAPWFPAPDRAMRGLTELLCNAVEHGSLEIGFELKGVLLEQGDWRAEVERRQGIEPYASRSVEATFSRRGEGRLVVITDQGPGFDWRRHLTVNPTRAGDAHGRGVALARTLGFDRVSYNEKGDRVAAFMRGGAGMEW